MNYFTDCYTVFDIKKRFRELAMKNHPDKGGDNETMRIILEQYHAALKANDGQTSTGTDGQEHTYYYNHDNEQAVADKISELLKMRMEGVDIALVGTWIWVSGNTKPYKSQLGKNGAKCRWHSKRNMWYWKPYQTRGRYNRRASFNDLADKYGYKHFSNAEDTVATL